MDYNKLVFTGNIGRDGELRFTPQGIPVCSFSVASNRAYISNEEKKTETTWLRCTLWNKRAEALFKYLLKGTRVLVEGRLSVDESGNPKTYTNKDGVTKASFDVFVDDIVLLGGKKSEEQTEDSQL